MEGEGCVTGSMNDELHSWNIQRDLMENEGGVTRSIIDEYHFRISIEITWKVKVVLLEVS